jgi:hypothetical protein
MYDIGVCLHGRGCIPSDFIETHQLFPTEGAFRILHWAETVGMLGFTALPYVHLQIRERVCAGSSGMH